MKNYDQALLKAKTKTVNKILGEFGKGNDNSKSINFSESGGIQCGTNCRFHERNPDRKPDAPTCYADRLERYRLNTRVNGIAKRLLSPSQIVNRALGELSCSYGIWLRFSSFGSLPFPKAAIADKQFVPALRRLLDHCRERNIKIHCPVETQDKADFYGPILAEYGFTVRLSAQSRKQLNSANIASSYVVGFGDKLSVANREIAAKKLASDLRETGRTAVVCPAIISDSKCGDCTACSSSKVDVILYPLH